MTTPDATYTKEQLARIKDTIFSGENWSSIPVTPVALVEPEVARLRAVIVEANARIEFLQQYVQDLTCERDSLQAERDALWNDKYLSPQTAGALGEASQPSLELPALAAHGPVVQVP